MRAAVSLVAVLLAATLAGCLGPRDGGDEAISAAGAAGPAGAAGIFSGTSFFPGAYDTAGPLSKVLVPGPHKPLPDEVVELKSDLDGAVIQIGLVRPDVPDDTKVPVIAMPSYGLRDMTEVPVREAHPGTNKIWFIVDNFVPHGYAVAAIPSRGTSGSGGCTDMGGAAEASDFNQAVTWLATQPWSNGAVGSYGLSGDGMFQWEVASMGNPHLKTIVPAGGFVDFYGSFVRNGTTSPFGFILPSFYQAVFGTSPFGMNPLRAPLGAQLVEPSRPAARNAEAATCSSYVEGQRAVLEAARTGTRSPAEFWEERDRRAEVLANYRGSVLLVHGLEDGTMPASAMFPFAAGLAEAGIPTKMLLGQWRHSHADDTTLPDRPNRSPRWDLAEVLLHWYDYWLKGDTTKDIGPAGQVADSAGAWRDEQSWPPRDAAPRTFFLAPGGSLAAEPSGESGSHRVVLTPAWSYATRNATAAQAACAPACAMFRTEPVPDELRFAGFMDLHLTVVPAGPGGHLTAYLFVEGPGGVQRVAYGAMDLRYAAGGEEPRPVTPGDTLLALMQLEAADVVVPAGSRLVLAVGQGAHRTGETFAGSETVEPLQPFPVEVRVGGELSTFTVSAFERGAEAIVAPPWGPSPS